MNLSFAVSQSMNTQITTTATCYNFAQLAQLKDPLGNCSRLLRASPSRLPRSPLKRKTQLNLYFSMADSEFWVLPRFDCNGSGLSGSNDQSAYAEIFVIRHGETEWNATKRLQGQLDVELNDVGRVQAAAVAHRLSKEPKISVVYSSDLKRTLDTAETIASSCGGLEVIKDPDLRERHLGDLQGLVHYEAAKVCPKAYRAFSSHRTDKEIPGGGESLDQLYDRCTSALERIGGKHKGEQVVVVTHGGVIRTLYERASPTGQPGRIMNTSVNIFHLSDGDIWTIKSWGDVSHLNPTEYQKSGFGGDRTSG